MSGAVIEKSRRKEKSMATVKLKRLDEGAKTPTHGSVFAAGYDLYACLKEDVMIAPHETKMISTGWAMQPPTGYYIAIVARSGLATKQGLRPANCYGACDEDYRGEVFVTLHNDSEVERVIHSGDRIAQMMLRHYTLCEFREANELDTTKRGANGFGSTGSK